MFEVKVFHDISELNKCDWEQASPSEFFFSYTFLKILVDSKVENATYKYLIFYSNKQPKGVAILSKFLLQLDLLTADKSVEFLKQIWPGLFEVPMICCGLPVSYGQRSFYVNKKSIEDAAVAATHQAMVKFSNDTGTDLLIWKEFDHETQLYSSLKQFDYISLPTIPDNRILLTTPDVKNFLQSFRSGYRRKYNELNNLIRGNGPVWENGTFSLMETDFSEADVDRFFHGYSKLMERTPVKLETYPKAFFIELARHKEINTKLISLKLKATEDTLNAIVVCNRCTAYFILIAKPKDHYPGAFYRQFIQSIVILTIRKNVKRIYLGQTSYFAKMTAGAIPAKLEIYVLIKTRWKHYLLRKFGHKLFPEIELPKVNAYSKRRNNATCL